MVEYERSYCFSVPEMQKFRNKFFGPGAGAGYHAIDDWYLDTNTRVRKQSTGVENQVFYINHKTGDKSSGTRIEDEESISEKCANILCKKNALHISKTRFIYSISSFDSYKITIDIVNAPMNLAILEIESNKHPVPSDITKQMFGLELTECPLSAYQYFKRRIGICGGPSSGKSTSAQQMSFLLNTEFGANSFHVAEVATTFIQKYNRHPQITEQFFMWHGQRERELSAGRANIVISDCPTFLSYIYLLHLPKQPMDFSSSFVLSKIYKRVLSDIQNLYTDLIFLQILNYAENNVRYQSKDEALIIEDKIRSFLRDHNVTHTETTYINIRQVLNQLFYLNSISQEYGNK